MGWTGGAFIISDFLLSRSLQGECLRMQCVTTFPAVTHMDASGSKGILDGQVPKEQHNNGFLHNERGCLH